MNALLVSVTRRDISNGLRAKSALCPVALAVQRATGDGGMRVSHSTIWKNTPYESFHAPRSVGRFIRRFDNRKPVTPFRFILREV